MKFADKSSDPRNNLPAKDDGLTRFSSCAGGNILWKYDAKAGRVQDLYELAKSRSWNVSADIPWDVHAARSGFPTSTAAEPFVGFSAYESLSVEEKREVCWLRHGLEISEILHGEQGALLVSSQLVSCMPTVDSKLFASSQVFDEARHVEFFSKYLREVVGEIHPPSRELKNLIELMVADPRWDIKFIACQILVESLAMAKFQEIKQSTRVPLLAFALDYIVRDEARHVNFGVQFLHTHLKQLSDEEIEERSSFVVDHVTSLANSMNVYTRIADRYQWNHAALRLHLRKFRSKNPQINRERFRQLMINLKTAGLLTQTAQQRLLALA